MSDERYDFKEQRLRQTTDFIYAIAQESKVGKEDEFQQCYAMLLHLTLGILDKKDGVPVTGIASIALARRGGHNNIVTVLSDFMEGKLNLLGCGESVEG